MTVTADPGTGHRESRQKAPKPSKASVQSPVQGKRRPAIIAAGIAFAIVMGLLAAWLFTSTGKTITVFTAKADLQRGDVIESGDLSTVEIPQGQQLPSYTVAQSGDVVGQFATVDIAAGSLISPSNIGAAAGVAEGTSIVGVALTKAQMPPYPLVNGDPVRVVETPINQGDPPAQTPPTIDATVVSSALDETSGNTVVALAVDERDAADLAARAATGRVALILDAGSGE